MSSHVDDFNTSNKVLATKLLRQGHRYHKMRKAFSLGSVLIYTDKLLVF